MKLTLFGLLLVVSFDLNDIATINALKKEAASAYTNGNYQQAFESYSVLIDSFEVADDEVLMNYANSAYFLTGLSDKIGENTARPEESNFAEAAMSNYQRLTSSKSPELKSSAYNQIGVINYHLGNETKEGEKYLSESLSYFKEALKASPRNDNARYNYEIVKKKLEDQKDQQNKDEENEDKEDNKEENNEDKNEEKDSSEENKENENKNEEESKGEENKEDSEENKSEENKEGEEGDEDKNKPEESEGSENEDKGEEEKEKQPQPSDKFEEMKISEDMAKMILEAMRNNEVQYIQQQKRKPTKKKDSSKPDW